MIVLLGIVVFLATTTFAQKVPTNKKLVSKAQKPKPSSVPTQKKKNIIKPSSPATGKIKKATKQVKKPTSDHKKNLITSLPTSKVSTKPIIEAQKTSPTFDRSVLKLFNAQAIPPVAQQQPPKSRTIAETLKLLNGESQKSVAKPVPKLSTQSTSKPSITPSTSNQVGLAKLQPKPVTKPKPQEKKNKSKKPVKKQCGKPKKHQEKKASGSRVNISNLINVNQDRPHHDHHHKRQDRKSVV